MNRWLILCVLSLSMAGCVREAFRPVATARSMGAERLGCADAEVFALDSDGWGRDPLMQPGDGTYLVQGCGRQAFFACSAVGTRLGRCGELPTGPYRSPEPTDAHAAIVTEVRSAVPAQAGLRELLLVEGAGWVARRATNDAPAIPVRTGALQIGIGAQPMHMETRLHSVPRSETTYSTSTDAYGRQVERSSTRYWTEYFKTRHLVAAQGCTQGVALQTRPGMTYRLVLELHGPGQCQVSCTQEAVVGGRLVRSTCEAFSPG